MKITDGLRHKLTTISKKMNTMQKRRAIHVLREAGITNPLRLVELIRKSIDFLELNLSGLTVLTEAASGPYVVTPVIASLAGASRILAITGNSKYASSEEVIQQTRALEVLVDAPIETSIYTQRPLDLFEQADVVTNLGFVRPIDEDAVMAMKPDAVIPLMCESWEFRPGDVDLDACHNRGIRVYGTNEDYPALDIFSYSGCLCMKMLFDAQIEIHKSQILLVSSDKFGRIIEKQLERNGCSVVCAHSLSEISKSDLTSFEAIIVADYTRIDMIIGDAGDILPSELAAFLPYVTVIQFAGRLDVKKLKASGIFVYPGIEMGPRRMSLTLADLGVKPVVELHAAGLKVGEVCSKINLDGPFKKLAQEVIHSYESNSQSS